MSQPTSLQQSLSLIPRCAVHDEFDKLSNPTNHSAICDRLLLFLHNTSRALSKPPPNDHLPYIQAGPDIVEIARCVARMHSLVPKLDCDRASQATATVATVTDQIARYQHKLALASQCDDLCNTVLEQLLVQVSQGISRIDLAHPFADYTQTNLESLVSIVEHDIPTYNSTERALLEAYTQVKEQAPSLLFAISAAREQVAAITHTLKSNDIFPALNAVVNGKLAQVESEWETLNKILDEYFSGKVRPRLSNVVQNMLVECILVCRRILVEKMEYEERVTLHKTCTRAVRMARQHMGLLRSESDNLTLYWARLNPQYERMLEYMELLQLLTRANAVPKVPRNKGINLHLDVGTHLVPFSVQRAPRRSQHIDCAQLPRLEFFKDDPLNNATDEEFDDFDTTTLVSKTPRVFLGFDYKHTPLSYEHPSLPNMNGEYGCGSLPNMNMSRFSSNMNREYKHLVVPNTDGKHEHTLLSRKYLNTKPGHERRIQSRIPRIVPNYIKLGYPMIEKAEGRLRIPTISASHPVFQSPKKTVALHTHATNPLTKSTFSGRLRPPATLDSEKRLRKAMSYLLLRPPANFNESSLRKATSHLLLRSPLSLNSNSSLRKASSHQQLRPAARLDSHPSYMRTFRTPSLCTPPQSAIPSPWSALSTPQHDTMESHVLASPYSLFTQSPATPIDITERGLPRPNIKGVTGKTELYYR